MIYAVGGQGIESNPKKILKHNKNALRNTLHEFAENQKQSFLNVMNNRIEHLQRVK
jgi:hypothetical protein